MSLRNFIVYGLGRFIPDRVWVQLKYFRRFHKFANLRNPKTFNEKIQWLKLYNRKIGYTELVDKYCVREHIKKYIGEQYLIPLIGVWDDPEEVDFDTLPDQFVLKCNHNSGGICICIDKKNLDYDTVRDKLGETLKHNYYWDGREWPYKYVKPRIICEKYMTDQEQDGLIDYKFMCFNGKVLCSFTCTERFSVDGLKVTFFDRDWNEMPFERHYRHSSKKIDKPKHYEKMIEIAECLSKDIPFVRVDLYEIENQIYFGELTFFPGDGMEEFDPEIWDYTLGSWLKLPSKKIKKL